MTDMTDADIRSQFPGLGDYVHLNTAGAGPLPAVALDAMHAALDDDGRHPRMSERSWQRHSSNREALREHLAALLATDTRNVALTSSATHAANAVIHGIHWRPGDRAITTSHEHPAIRAPLMAAAHRYGIVVDEIRLDSGDESLHDLVIDRARPSTRLIALSHVSWLTGATLDVAGAARAARQVGALTLVDGAQAAGAVPVDPAALGCDAYVVAAPKWTLGPQGIGALWISGDARRAVAPTITGLGSMEPEPGHGPWRDDARRYEVGALAEVLVPGWSASLQWLSELGMEWIHARIGRCVDRVWSELTSRGHMLLTPTPATSGIISFRPRRRPAGTVVAELEEMGIVTRWSEPIDAVRVSPGFFCTEQDILALVRALDAVGA